MANHPTLLRVMVVVVMLRSSMVIMGCSLYSQVVQLLTAHHARLMSASLITLVGDACVVIDAGEVGRRDDAR